LRHKVVRCGLLIANICVILLLIQDTWGSLSEEPGDLVGIPPSDCPATITQDCFFFCRKVLITKTYECSIVNIDGVRTCCRYKVDWYHCDGPALCAARAVVTEKTLIDKSKILDVETHLKEGVSQRLLTLVVEEREYAKSKYSL